MNKICSKCGNEYPATTEYWHRNKARSDGLADYCKSCKREANKQTCRKTRATPEGRDKARAAVLKTNRRLVTDPLTGATISAGALSSRKRLQNGKYQAYLDNNPVVKLRHRLSSLIRMSMKGRGFSKATKTAQLLGCSFQEFKSHIESQFKDGMSWENQGTWHYDHLIPCSSATTEDELNALQHWSNFQPIWGSENQSKSDTLPPDWKERKAKLMAIYWNRFPERREAA